jgi:hypothetical protein
LIRAVVEAVNAALRIANDVELAPKRESFGPDLQHYGSARRRSAIFGAAFAHTLTLSLVRERASKKPSARSLSTQADEKLFSL